MVATYHSKLKGPRPRKQPKHGVDRISELPDEVLCHILSFLPSKEACATRVLSTRWRSLWTMVPVLDFVANSVTPLKGFSTIVNEFLTLRTTQRITRLRLKCTKELCHQDDVDKWVSSATEGKVEQLELSLHHFSGYMCSTTNLFTCGTIVTLKLRGCFYLSVPSSSSVHLPFLKTLHLNVRGNSEDVSKLLSGCPALEVFRVKLICFEGSFKICVPSLKQLRVVARCCQVKQLEMNTPCLECLDLCHCVYIHDYVFGNLQNVVRAKINIDIRVDGDEYEDCLHGVFKLLKLLPNVRFFSFYDFTMKKMENLFIVLDRPAHFRNLVHLQLSLRMGYGLFFLEKLLRKCRKLQVQPFTRTGPNNCSYFSEECKGLDD